MGAGEPGCGQLRAAGAGCALIRHPQVWLALLLLAGCSRSVMVERVEDAPPPVRRPSAPAPAAADREYTVQPGDTLYKISVQYGVDYRDLAAWNGIEAPYTIYPKQRLRVGALAESTPAAAVATAPARPQPAVADAPSVPPAGADRVGSAGTSAAAPSTSPPPAPGYDPGLGVTLPEGAQPISASAPAAGAAPVFEDPSPPAPAAAAAAAATTTTVSAPASPMPTAANPPPPTPVATTPAAAAAPAAATPPAGATPAPAPGADVAAARPSAAGWIWPATGKVVATYAGGDPTRQGIDIAGETGQPVRAARDGEVVYSGAGLIGYGELVIVKHSPELLSAYGHNRVRLVKEGDKVKAGQKIAEMGSNAANRVLLHFEIRRNGKPVDPLPLLPAR